MKKIILAFAVLFIVACDNPNTLPSQLKETYGALPQNIEQIEIEGCQYIGKFSGSNRNWGSHKGNCTNPIHNKVDTIQQL